VNSAPPEPVESPDPPETPSEARPEPRVEAPALPDTPPVAKPEPSPRVPPPWAKIDLAQVPLAFNTQTEADPEADPDPVPPAPKVDEEPEPERLSQLTVASSSAALVSTKRPSRHRQQSSVRRNAPPPRTPPELPNPYEQLDLLTRKKPPSTGSRLFLVLPLAALLGCAVGYWGYLQLPSPIIPLKVRGLSRSVLVSWPAEDTRNAVYAAIRVNDATPVLLSPEEKAAGQMELSASPDIKVELIARNWMRDSRGIVRFVKAENVNERSTIP